MHRLTEAQIRALDFYAMGRNTQAAADLARHLADARPDHPPMGTAFRSLGHRARAVATLRVLHGLGYVRRNDWQDDAPAVLVRYEITEAGRSALAAAQNQERTHGEAGGGGDHQPDHGGPDHRAQPDPSG